MLQDKSVIRPPNRSSNHSSPPSFSPNFDLNPAVGQFSILQPKQKSKHFSKKLLPGDWICMTCEMNNFASRSHCLQCGAPGADAPRPADRPGDWSCPRSDCRYHNFASRTQCYKCKAPRMTSAPATQEVEPRLGDWHCPQADCRFLNFAKRSRCIKCGTHHIAPSELKSNSPTDSTGFYSLFSGGSFFSNVYNFRH